MGEFQSTLDNVIALIIKNLPKPVLAKLASEAQDIDYKEAVREMKRQMAFRLIVGNNTISRDQADSYLNGPGFYTRVIEYVNRRYGHLIPEHSEAELI